jgi:hypothetical protein
MARIRTIKPEFFTSHDIVSLTPLSRLFYISLWCESDREGRLNWNTRTFKMRYLPADDCDIDELANELIEAGLIIIYEIDGKKYAEIPSFKNHQVINNRETDSIIPSRVKVACKRVLAEGRKEGKEGKESASRETSLPSDFSISENVKTWAIEKGHTDLNLHLEHFKGVCLAKGYKYKDWDSAFMNAVRSNWAKLELKTDKVPDWKRDLI